MPFEDNDPAPTLPLGVTVRQFSARSHLRWHRFTANLFLFFQIINRLSYSVVYARFQVHIGIIHQTESKSQTYVRIFSKKTQKFFGVIHNEKWNREQETETGAQRFNESPPAARRKGDPQADQRGRLFRGGALCRCSVFVAVCSKRRFYCVVCGDRFALKRGVSLSAAARSAAALVYDKLTPNCHPSIKVVQLNI